MSAVDPGQQGSREALSGLPIPAPKGGLLPTVKPPALPVFGATPDALSLLKALRRRWALALALGTACAALGGTATWLIVPPPKYTARAMFRVATDPPRYIFPTGEGKTDLATYQQTQVTLIKSRGVLDRALAKDGIGKLSLLGTRVDPVEWLEKELRVDYSGEILRISLSGTRPDELTKLVNAVVDAYQQEVVDKERTVRIKRHDDLKAIYNTYQARLETKRKQLRTTAEVMGSNDKTTLTLKHQYVIERLAMAERELMEHQAELRRARAEAAVRQPEAPAAPGVAGPREAPAAPGVAGPREAPAAPGVAGPRNADPAVEQYIQREPGVARLADRVAELEQKVAAARRIARKGIDPAVRAPVLALAQARQALEDRRASLRAELKGPARDGIVRAQDAGPDSLRERIAMLVELERTTGEVVRKLSEESKSFNHGSMGLESLQDEIGHADNAAKRIGDEVEALGVELKAPSRVSLIEKAGTPRPDDEKGPIKLAGMSALGAFALVLTGVSLYEFRSRRIGSVDEVVHGLGMRIVGTLPAIPGRGMRRAGVARDAGWQRLLIESVDAARTMLMHAARAESHRVVMITSALGGEGKTSLSCHLATSLARAGRRTLLVDCDLRSPSVHRLFDVVTEPGFSEYLRGEAGLAEVVRPTAVEGLSILPAGRCDSRAIQALALDEVRAAFDWMKANYDFVVVDSSPVLPVADSLTLAQYVDAVLFSILSDVSRMTKVYAASMRMSELGIRVLGAVVTGAQGELYGPEYLYGQRTHSAATAGPIRGDD